MVDASIYYKEAFGITPEKALENEEKLHQMEELVASLEAEVKRKKEKKVSFWRYIFSSRKVEFFDPRFLLQSNINA